MSEVAPTALLDWLRDAESDPALSIVGYASLSGGAIQENRALDVVRGNGCEESWVLRTDAASGVSLSHSREQEYALLDAAYEHGVTVPEPLHLCADPDVLGAPFFIMRRVDGTASPVHIVKKTGLDEAARERLLVSIATELARIHAIPLADPRLAPLARKVPPTPIADAVAHYRYLLDDLGARRPVLEWALAWLELHEQPLSRVTLCHRDFRTGNLMVLGERVTGVLDWEFAGFGDPLEDIGWFTAPCWRFGAIEREAGGIGARATFRRAYEAAAGVSVDDAAVRIWEIVATVRWAVIALQQGARFTSGAEPSLELGLTGRMIATLERDLIDLVCAIDGIDQTIPPPDGDPPPTSSSASTSCAASAASAASTASITTTEPIVPSIDAPAGDALLAVARTLLLSEVLPSVGSEQRYPVLMIANAMAMALREMRMGASLAQTDRAEGQQALQLHADRTGDRPAPVDDTIALADFSTRIRQAGLSNAETVSVLPILVRDVARRLALSDPKRLGESTGRIGAG